MYLRLNLRKIFFSVPGEPLSSPPLPDTDKTFRVESTSELPWMVSLGGFKDANNWDHECGGSLVTNTHVLTAAHCKSLFKDDYMSGPQMRLGTTNLRDSKMGTTRHIIKFLRHPKYLETRSYYDVGIAVADIPIDFTDFIRYSVMTVVEFYKSMTFLSAALEFEPGTWPNF